jgi:hypothetical protein
MASQKVRRFSYRLRSHAIVSSVQVACGKTPLFSQRFVHMRVPSLSWYIDIDRLAAAQKSSIKQQETRRFPPPHPAARRPT